MKFEQKLKALVLRKEGKSYRQIMATVNVSRSTLSRWLRAIELTQEQKEQLLSKRTGGSLQGALSQKLKRVAATKEQMDIGLKEYETFLNNPLFLCGLSLYWAEGDKHDAESVKFTNSDPKMIFLMMKWFREICKVPEHKFRIGLHIHSLHINKDVKEYWSDITGINENQFHKTYVKQTSLGQRKKVLYNGTCAIIINNKQLFRRIMGWKQGISKHFRIMAP